MIDQKLGEMKLIVQNVQKELHDKFAAINNAFSHEILTAVKKAMK